MRNAVITYCLLYLKNTFYWMVRFMSIASFTCYNFHLIDTWFLFSQRKKNLHAKVEKDLIFLSLPFFKLEWMIHYLVVIPKLWNSDFIFYHNLKYTRTTLNKALNNSGLLYYHHVSVWTKCFNVSVSLNEK